MKEPVYGEFCWSELATNDVGKAKEFYTTMFGWQFEDLPIEGMTYTLIKGKNDVFGGIWQIPQNLRDQIPPHWMSYILVEDAQKALDKAKQLGAQEVKEVTQAGDKGRFAIITDPVGAHIALWESSHCAVEK